MEKGPRLATRTLFFFFANQPEREKIQSRFVNLPSLVVITLVIRLSSFSHDGNFSTCICRIRSYGANEGRIRTHKTQLHRKHPRPTSRQNPTIIPNDGQIFSFFPNGR